MSLGGNNNELACVYAALILHDDGMEITGESIASILKAAGIETEAYWPTLFAKLCQGKDMNALVTAVGAGGSRRMVVPSTRRNLVRVPPMSMVRVSVAALGSSFLSYLTVPLSQT